MQFFDLAKIPPSPWKNGGGSTRELACWPPGAGMDSFEWRVSVATIAASGPFSAFAEVDRQIMLLDGDGVQLSTADNTLNHALVERWQPFAFSGDVAVDCQLQGGTSTDFNLMLRRGAWQGDVEVINQTCQPGSTPAGLCLVLAGMWQVTPSGESGQYIKPGQGWWWHDQTATPLRLQPVSPPNQPACVAWVGLSPTAS